jgi:hypothetical protein
MTAHIDACWRKSSFSMGNGNCVETALLADRSVAVRDSKRPEDAVLIFTESEWTAFLAGAKNDEFDL